MRKTVSPSLLAVLKTLGEKKEGCFCEDIAEALGIESNAASKLFSKLKDRNMVMSLSEPRGSSKRRNRYYLPEFAHIAEQAHKDGYGNTWGPLAMSPKKMNENRQQRMDKLKKIVVTQRDWLPAVVPPREPIHVDKPEPFFSRPGYRTSSIGQDTWTARVYGQN